MTTVNMEFRFIVPKNVIFEALTHPMYFKVYSRKVMQYTRAPAKVEPKEGG